MCDLLQRSAALKERLLLLQEKHPAFASKLAMSVDSCDRFAAGHELIEEALNKLTAATDAIEKAVTQ